MNSDSAKSTEPPIARCCQGPEFPYNAANMVVRMRRNRSQTGQRRSHHALAATRVARCECGALRRPHIACAECGKYNGRVVIDVVERAKREARRTKRHQTALRESGQVTDDKKEETVKS